MTTVSDPAAAARQIIDLADTGTYRLSTQPGVELRVLAGAVWVTAAGAAADRLLTAGDALRFERSGPAWVEPCALSTLVVERLGSVVLQ